jgi:HEAT repeat protein
MNRAFRALSKILENRYTDYSPRLIELLNYRSNDPRVVSYVLRIMGELQLSDHLTDVLPFLNSEDARTRANAVEAVGRMDVGLDYLVPFLNDTNNRVRANAVVALAGKNVVDITYAVMDMAVSQDIFLRKSALFAIREIKDKLFVKTLAGLLRDEDETIRTQALEVLQLYEICGITEATQILKEGGFSIY